jgi:hypothetical protein
MARNNSGNGPVALERLVRDRHGRRRTGLAMPVSASPMLRHPRVPRRRIASSLEPAVEGLCLGGQYGGGSPIAVMRLQRNWLQIRRLGIIFYWVRQQLP